MKQLKDVLLIIMFSIIVISFYINKKLKEENVILNNNQKTLLDSVVHYKIADSLNAARITELQLKSKELIKYYPKE